MTRADLIPLIGQSFSNNRTGTVARLVDVTPNDLAWLSNGATIPIDDFVTRWQLVTWTADEILRRES